MSSKLRVGVAGPVGSGKTALVETLCIGLKKKYKIAVVTNDIYTKEDANFLIKKRVLEEGRIVGVETGGCPHTAIREDCSINKNAVIKISKYNKLLFFIYNLDSLLSVLEINSAFLFSKLSLSEKESPAKIILALLDNSFISGL